jgi:alpha-beta hydrolase superfamily lysophospholipase
MSNAQISATTETIGGPHGVDLFMRSWKPRTDARGVIVIVPGFKAHSGYYRWVAEQLIEGGLAVYAVDLRGRGQSSGERFYVEKIDDWANDVASVVAVARARDPGLPIFLLGHSAGGVVACIYTLDHQKELAGFICESFAFQVPGPEFALAVFKGLSHLVPHAHLFPMKNEAFSRDPDAVRAMNEDPLIADEVQPTQTLAEMVRADERLKEEFPRIKLPLLILHGTADKVTKPSGSQLFYENAGSRDKSIKLYEGHYHDLLNDIDKELVVADIKGWIETRIPRARPSPRHDHCVRAQHHPIRAAGRWFRGQRQSDVRRVVARFRWTKRSFLRRCRTSSTFADSRAIHTGDRRRKRISERCPVDDTTH